MAVLEMLTEVICSEELFAGVAFAEFVNILQVTDTLLPVLVVHETSLVDAG